MLTRMGAWARDRAAQEVPWTNVYGLARSLLALGTALTLVFTHSSYLFERGAGIVDVPVCRGVGRIGLFCIAGHSHLELARWLFVAALLVVASGYRPRLTALLHWWLAFSLHNNAVVLDGGDQVTLVLATLLLPLALTDRRRWHWDPPLERTCIELPMREELRRLVGLFAIWLLRIQVAGIYFHAAMGKFGVEEWADGTAVYYFFRNPSFGATPAVLHWIDPVLWSAVGVCAITWGTVLLEYVLSAALFMQKRYWRPLLIMGLALHAGIAVIHGLVSFALAMFAALILYLRPMDQTFAWAALPTSQLASAVRRLARRALPERARHLPVDILTVSHTSSRDRSAAAAFVSLSSELRAGRPSTMTRVR
jgi:antimicrobial peptide system SdpB family protein